MKEYEGSWSLRGVGRFRVNILRQRSSFMIVMRVISDVLPTFEQLNLPARDHACDARRRGPHRRLRRARVGPLHDDRRRSSTTSTPPPRTRRHCVLIEQPIEYLHKSQKWSMTQREVGSDTESFEDGVRAAILQDADAIVIGGLEQPAVRRGRAARRRGRAASSSAAWRRRTASAAIRNLLQRMESEDQQSARLRLAEALHAVVAQKLIPRQNGGRRVLATQLLYMTPYVRETILDAGSADNLERRAREGTRAVRHADVRPVARPISCSPARSRSTWP